MNPFTDLRAMLELAERSFRALVTSVDALAGCAQELQALLQLERARLREAPRVFVAVEYLGTVRPGGFSTTPDPVWGTYITNEPGAERELRVENIHRAGFYRVSMFDPWMLFSRVDVGPRIAGNDCRSCEFEVQLGEHVRLHLRSLLS